MNRLQKKTQSGSASAQTGNCKISLHFLRPFNAELDVNHYKINTYDDFARFVGIHYTLQRWGDLRPKWHYWREGYKKWRPDSSGRHEQTTI